MDSRTQNVLEFGLLREEIARRAAGELGRSWALALEPLPDADAAAERARPTREIMMLLANGESPPLDGAFDATALFQQARIPGSVLDLEHWPRVARFLDVCARLAAFREGRASKTPALATILSGLDANEDLARRLARLLDEKGGLRDDATPELAQCRRGLREGERRLLRTVSDLAARLHDSGILQDKLSTIRNGRHVLPVRTSARGRLRGIMHGSSASGETVYIEPPEIVEASNELEVLREREIREIHRILAELTDELRPWADLGLHNVAVLRHVDGLLAIARTAHEKGWSYPLVTRGGPLRLFNAHHPLLQLRAPRSVPITMLLEPGDQCLVLSGPNAGGKTTAMKTIGLLAVLVQCGCPVPAFPDSAIPFFTAVHADIGDTQSLEEGVSTFTGHIRHIADMYRQADGQALVLLDELGTGTDPHEGGALAIAILMGLLRRASLTVTTSHLGPVKTWAEDTPGVRNASFSLDPETRAPTFRLRLDLPGASEALEIAEREGLDARLLAEARKLVGESHLRMGDLLRRIEEREQRLGAAVREAEARAASLAEQERVARARSESLRDERREFRDSLAAEKERAIAETRERVERLIAGLPGEEELQRRKEALVRAREELLRSQQLTGEERRRLAEEQVRTGEITTGQRVFIATLGQWGEVLREEKSGKAFRVLVGNLEVSATTEDLLDHDPAQRREERRQLTEEVETSAAPRKRGKKSRRARQALRRVEPSPPSSQASSFSFRSASVTSVQRPSSMTLDLHGYRVEEALAELDRFIDRSLLANFPYIKICHGTGTGRLYRAVHEFLRGHPSVRNYRFATPDEGGGGMTIVDL